MTVAARRCIVLLLALSTPSPAFKPGNFRIQVTTTDFCIEALKDQNGDSAPCAISTTQGTEGLTLPGMEGHFVTTVEDVVVVKDGTISVKAMPARPYEFVMTTQNATHETVHMLYKHKAYFAQHFGEGYQTNGAKTLLEDGWVQIDTAVREPQSLLTWVKQSLGGIHPETGFNFTHFYSTGNMPDTWTLHTDLEENPVSLVATNSYYGHTVHQVTGFANRQDLDETLTLEMAKQEMLANYQIGSDRDVPLPLDYDRNTSSSSASFVPDRVAPFYEAGDDADWLDQGNLRNAHTTRISYYKVELGSASDLYFEAIARRRLGTLEFVFPSGCNEVKPTSTCFRLKISDGVRATSLSLRCAVKDVLLPDKKMYMTLSITIDTQAHKLTALSGAAGGCATVWSMGAGVATLAIVVCAEGGVEADWNTDGTISAKASMTYSVQAGVFVDYLGTLADIKLTIHLSVSIGDSISADAGLVVSQSIWFAGVSFGLDCGTGTTDDSWKRWVVESGFSFSVWINIIVWKASSSKRYPLWKANLG